MEACHPSCWSWGSGADQVDQPLPRHYRLHFSEKLLPFGLLIGGGEFVTEEAELPATHQLSPGLRSQDHCRVDEAGFSRGSLTRLAPANAFNPYEETSPPMRWEPKIGHRNPRDLLGLFTPW